MGVQESLIEKNLSLTIRSSLFQMNVSFSKSHTNLRRTCDWQNALAYFERTTRNESEKLVIGKTL
jgi:hypothetical protein